jgi:hypothetical protein
METTKSKETELDEEEAKGGGGGTHNLSPPSPEGLSMQSPSPSQALRPLLGRGVAQFDLLAAEDEDLFEAFNRPGDQQPPITRQLKSRRSFRKTKEQRKNMYQNLQKHLPGISIKQAKDDPYGDLNERNKAVIGLQSLGGDNNNKDNSTVENEVEIVIPSLRECRNWLVNDHAEAYHEHVAKPRTRVAEVVLNFSAAFYIYLVNTVGLETIAVTLNAVLAAFYYCHNAADFAVKLDFSFLSFSVVFPLTFLIQSTFARRDQALVRFFDFKSAVLTTALFTLTCDWANSSDGKPNGGRLAMPEDFNAGVVADLRELVQLVYEYLSMPNVSHARHVVFHSKQKAARHVHALQNDIVKGITDNIFDLTMHTEVMRQFGFPSGEASRLHQYHQFIQQRFEQLRTYKYYRTPQATRSFGRVYIFILPWISGPYFAWVFESTNYSFTLTLAGFTFIVMLGLLNAQKGMEDPFCAADLNSWTPGIDTIKLEFELAQTLQAIHQYYAQAKLRRLWLLQGLATKEDKNIIAC